jgi:hypothetical protein
MSFVDGYTLARTSTAGGRPCQRVRAETLRFVCSMPDIDDHNHAVATFNDLRSRTPAPSRSASS